MHSITNSINLPKNSNIKTGVLFSTPAVLRLNILQYLFKEADYIY